MKEKLEKQAQEAFKEEEETNDEEIYSHNENLLQSTIRNLEARPTIIIREKSLTNVNQ